ncbi:MAG: FHIPEP family type III secretion protein, partial [Candidatus Thiodiazotropha taylori]
MSIQAFLHTEKNSDHGILSNVSDLFLAVGIVAIIALMVLPLPLLVLDALVALNIVIGLILVLMGVYITSPLQFSVFPSVLLISTLYRLALSVATTRMILLHGDAGHIIDTFGNMVAGGNIVVGLVVFLIITLVQFIVIAKGAERVAEVAARFTLDAMPGKQLSIDSDLRSGLIDKDEAKRKRREIELESKLHGSMDGAMKFVKGDAIAGIVIIIINLIGGLAIGVLQLDMDMGAAMAKYSILTVGDGMVAQIPALLGAMSAGLIVTRATDEKSDRHLGDSIQKQLTAIPRVTLVAGGLCLLLALVPGFPSGIFVGIGVLLLLSGALLVPFWKSKIEKVTKPTFEVILSSKESTNKLEKVVNPISEVKPAVPLLLQLPVELSDTEKSKNLMAEIEKKINEYQVDIGILLPKINLHWYG